MCQGKDAARAWRLQRVASGDTCGEGAARVSGECRKRSPSRQAGASSGATSCVHQGVWTGSQGPREPLKGWKQGSGDQFCVLEQSGWQSVEGGLEG